MGSRETAKAPKDGARLALAKSEELTASAEDDLAARRWNAAGLSAIHAGICSGDAALIAVAGIRSTSQDHGAVIALLESQVAEFTATQRRQLSGLLKMKNKVSYEQRLISETEARQLVDHAKRLAKWARAIVPGT